MPRNERDVAAMSEYSYTFNKADIYTGEYASIEDALAEARQEAELYPEGDKPCIVYIGRYKPFKPVIEAAWVLDVLQRDAYDVSDAAEGWLDNLTPACGLGERYDRQKSGRSVGRNVAFWVHSGQGGRARDGDGE